MIIERIDIRTAAKKVGYKNLSYFKSKWVSKNELDVLADEGSKKEYLILSEFEKVFNGPSIKALNDKYSDGDRLKSILDVSSQILQVHIKAKENTIKGKIENDVLSRLLKLLDKV